MTDHSQILKNVRTAIRGKFPLYNLGFGRNLDFNFLEVMSMENNGRAQRIYEDHDATQQLQVSSFPLRRTTYHQRWATAHVATAARPWQPFAQPPRGADKALECGLAQL